MKDGKGAARMSGRVQKRAGDLSGAWPGWRRMTVGRRRRPHSPSEALESTNPKKILVIVFQ